MSKIKRILMAIKQFGFSDTDFDMLVEQMYKLVAVAPKMTSTARVLDPGTTVYRGTNHHISVPTRIEDIWYPTRKLHSKLWPRQSSWRSNVLLLLASSRRFYRKRRRCACCSVERPMREYHFAETSMKTPLTLSVKTAFPARFASPT